MLTATSMRALLHSTLIIAVSSAVVKSTFYGTTSVHITDGNSSIFFDAFFTRPSFKQVINDTIGPHRDLIRETLRQGGVDQLDAIFVAHSHYYHDMNAPDVLNITNGKTMYGSNSTLNIGRGAGLEEGRTKLIKEGDIYDIGNFTIQVFEGLHSPGNTIPGIVEEPLQESAAEGLRGASEFKENTILPVEGFVFA
ncbi:unnamed protein product [Zymoseptoria tritici ST99CH_1E4]|uniref:Metallo-beta-lactamase domain-containing protein n=1 Tax=Zymoseptoria tritici ST99CH_1E4 TaxID=1276532 RepID=A0A2H1FP94_ZYMTR|nr:unnamed protein product [Zymoseptoria tritici ST99CH_1E4]